MKQLESALVLVLRDTIKWESAIVADSGTLTPINPAAVFDSKSYQARDRALAYRDLILGAAVVEVAIQTGDVWNYAGIKPNLEGPVLPVLTFKGTEAGAVDSSVRHVTSVSIPYDAARYADADLYGRDSLIYEVLARACQTTFEEPAITPVDATGTVIPGTSAWSLAEGLAGRADINPANPLNVALFKNPDMNLADRDNQLAGYAARMVQILKNPFENALRLYVQFTDHGTVVREPDVFALVSEDGTNRFFQSEPALPNANQFVYSLVDKTLHWLSSDIDTVHVPQLYAMEVAGLTSSQKIQTLARVPDVKDAQYWRSKAGQLEPDGIEILDTDLFMRNTRSRDMIDGGVMQRDGISLTVPDTLTFKFNGSLPQGNCRVSALLRPDSQVSIAGINNLSYTTGTLSGATFDVNVSSGSITNKQYIVVGGSGIVYNGGTYAVGSIFTGTNSVATYTQAGVLPSTVRQYSVDYYMTLPVGAWNVQIEYTNLSGTTNGFQVQANAAFAGGVPVPVIQNAAPIPFNRSNGQLMRTGGAGFDVSAPVPFHFPVYWTGGAGQLHIRRLLFTTSTKQGHYSFSGAFCGSLATADIIGESGVAGVVNWDFYNSGTTSYGLHPFTVNCTGDFTLPVRVEQVGVKSLDYFNTTPFSSGFQAWRFECLERAGRSIAQNYNRAVKAYGTAVPSFRDSGSNWSPMATENWMSFVEVYNPRVREILDVQSGTLVPGHQYQVVGTNGTYNGTVYHTGQKFYGAALIQNGSLTYAGTYSGDTLNQVGAFAKSVPGDLGAPALIPRGLYFNGTTYTPMAYYDTSESTPILTACQPWMIEQGIYVAKPEFRASPYFGVSLLQ